MPVPGFYLSNDDHMTSQQSHSQSLVIQSHECLLALTESKNLELLSIGEEWQMISNQLTVLLKIFL